MEIQRACIYYIKLLKIQCILTLIYIIAAHLYSSAAYGLCSCIPALLLGKSQTIFINLILRVSGCTKIKIIIISFISGICTRNKRARSLLSLLLLYTRCYMVCTYSTALCHIHERACIIDFLTIVGIGLCSLHKCAFYYGLDTFKCLIRTVCQTLKLKNIGLIKEVPWIHEISNISTAC